MELPAQFPCIRQAQRHAVMACDGDGFDIKPLEIRRFEGVVRDPASISRDLGPERAMAP